MLAVNGYYENGVCVPVETLVLREKQRVIITVLDDYAPNPADAALGKQQRADVLKSLSGILPSTISDEEVKACRVTK